MTRTPSRSIQIVGPLNSQGQDILAQDALAFLHQLHQQFEASRQHLLKKRNEREAELNKGVLPSFLAETKAVRESEWNVAPAPSDLQDRRVEITGPVDRKMMINALNSGARVFMADFEDSCAPSWSNIIHGQINCRDAVRRTISFQNPDGKEYQLAEKTATLVVRPRGWHLHEKHVLVDGQPMSASLFDFGLYFYHNAAELVKQGSGPYFYLPKMENHLEARLWNDVFVFAQKTLDIPQGTIRATVLIETILAAFEMEEILYELRDHAAGLNAGRWDYIFSAIKKFRHFDYVFPDRAQITMDVPFMKAYCELLVKTCHKRGAHAIGGMAAFIPNRKDPEVTEHALQKVREDKERECAQGFDGTWVAHPDLVPVAMGIFDRALGAHPHQKNVLRTEVQVSEQDLLNFTIPEGQVSEAGIRTNMDVALQYLEKWLSGTGAVAIHNLMEDAATAEISRAQLWQWLHHSVNFEHGRKMTPKIYQMIRTEELEKLSLTSGSTINKYREAAELLDVLVLPPQFEEFFTLRAYEYLN